MGKDHPDADLHPEATGPAALTVKVRSKIECGIQYKELIIIHTGS
jgi:hypothetical protein